MLIGIGFIGMLTGTIAAKSNILLKKTILEWDIISLEKWSTAKIARIPESTCSKKLLEGTLPARSDKVIETVIMAKIDKISS